jgi:hypothetical protein
MSILDRACWNQLVGVERSIYRKQKAGSSSTSIEFGSQLGKKGCARLSSLRN